MNPPASVGARINSWGIGDRKTQLRPPCAGVIIRQGRAPADRVDGMTDSPIPEERGQRENRRSRIWIVASIAAGAAVAIAAVAILPALLIREEITPADLVKRYLSAVADGDAGTARSYLQLADGDDALLTDEVLASAAAHGAITDVEIGDPYEVGPNTQVPVSFAIGDSRMSGEFAVRARDSGSELAIVDGVSPVLTEGLEDLGLTANGFAVPEDAVLFPGAYDFATTSPYVVVAETRLVGEGSAAGRTVLDPALTDLGLETYRRMVDSSLSECLALRTLATPCGTDLTGRVVDGSAAVEGTVSRTLTEDGRAELDGIDAEFLDGTTVTSTGLISVSFEYGLENGDRVGGHSAFTPLGAPTVDFAAEPLTVTWR